MQSGAKDVSVQTPIGSIHVYYLYPYYSLNWLRWSQARIIWTRCANFLAAISLMFCSLSAITPLKHLNQNIIDSDTNTFDLLGKNQFGVYGPRNFLIDASKATHGVLTLFRFKSLKLTVAIWDWFMTKYTVFFVLSAD